MKRAWDQDKKMCKLQLHESRKFTHVKSKFLTTSPLKLSQTREQSYLCEIAPFKPVINEKSRKLHRNQSIDDILYQDFQKRKALSQSRLQDAKRKATENSPLKKKGLCRSESILKAKIDKMVQSKLQSIILPKDMPFIFKDSHIVPSS